MLLLLAFAGFLALTIDFIPFTRPYRPGHAKLKTRWPVYLAGAYALSYGFVSIERLAWNDPVRLYIFIGVLVGLTVAFDVAGRYTARSWIIGSPGDGWDDDPNATIVLGLDAAENRPMGTAAS